LTLILVLKFTRNQIFFSSNLKTIYSAFMPRGLSRFQHTGQLHFVTFSCYRRQPLLAEASSRILFERALERMRCKYSFYVCGYVVMPEHVHILLSEPERKTLSAALQSIKQAVSRRIGSGDGQTFWQARYYDFNVFTESKRIEKLHYMHQNPVKRGLVSSPEDWPGSSYRHLATGEECIVEIESRWTAQRREQMGEVPKVRIKDPALTNRGLERGTLRSTDET
jgi:putative transposase